MVKLDVPGKVVLVGQVLLLHGFNLRRKVAGCGKENDISVEAGARFPAQRMMLSLVAALLVQKKCQTACSLASPQSSWSNTCCRRSNNSEEDFASFLDFYGENLTPRLII